MADKVKRKKTSDVQFVGTKPAEVVDIDSNDSESSSSSSSGRSRSRERHNKHVGAAAATALITAEQAIDVDQPDEVAERDLKLPTAFAAQLQHEGGTVLIMADEGVDISVSPSQADVQSSTLHIVGTEHAVHRAVERVELAFTQYQAQATALNSGLRLARIEVPAEHLVAVQSSIAEIRQKCDGIMIAIQPCEQIGGPLIAVCGPGEEHHVARAEQELRNCLSQAKTEMGTKTESKTDMKLDIGNGDGRGATSDEGVHASVANQDAITENIGEKPGMSESEAAS